ncbi:MAG: DUF4838 domain-containing protein [Kiritimatiellia bacterium]
MLLTEKGASHAPIVIAPGASPVTVQAAGELAKYIEKISGALPQVTNWAGGSLPESAVWVGIQSNVPGLDAGIKVEFEHPEEILLACDGKNVIITGRDRMAGTNHVEFGTANAVYTFIEDKLDVRWLWPGKLGEDIITNDTISIAPFEYRFHPPFRQRIFWPRQPRDWYMHQRMLYDSCDRQGGHAFTDWWDKYHEARPEYFALQPNGTRAAPREGSTVKICISNPGVWSQWLDNAEQKIIKDPSLMMLSASPNDGPWHCTCTNCRAWDHPGAPPEVLTERHVKFWNILARGLRERFPDREVYVGAMAYAAYGKPPVAEPLEKNIAIAHVGFFPLTSEESREQQKKEWRQWADKTTLMFYRPNLWYWSGGVWSLPEVAFEKTIEDFRFLADNRCTGISVDTVRGHWATQGPQYYLMAQLAYNPCQDGEAVMKDYYRRGFGPAAREIESYWKMMEKARDTIAAQPDFKLGSSSRYKLPAIFQRVYDDDFMAKADGLLKRAEARAARGDDIYRRRVAFVRAGYDFERLLIRTIPLMTTVREGQGKPAAEAAVQAQANWKAMEDIAKKAEPFAIAFKALQGAIQGKGYQGGMQDYFGPPSEEMIADQAKGGIQLRQAEWKPAFSDDFRRSEPGPGWEIIQGKCSVENGCLVVNGEARLMLSKTFSGLQKITFDAVATPSPGLSDVSPFIHAGTNGFGSGYMLQFGGAYNQRSAIHRMGRLLLETKRVIEPNKVHSVAAEYDGVMVRLAVDGKTVLEYAEKKPLLGAGHERIGLYVYEGIVKISNLKVYTSEAVQKTASADGAGFE